MSDNGENRDAADIPIEDQAREQTGQRQVRLRINEQDLNTCYANAFRTNATAEEVMLDFGLNVAVPVPPDQAEQQAQINFNVMQRVILNYYSAKRLAIALSQAVRRHEQQFGEIELDVTKRRQS